MHYRRDEPLVNLKSEIKNHYLYPNPLVDLLPVWYTLESK